MNLVEGYIFMDMVRIGHILSTKSEWWEQKHSVQAWIQDDGKINLSRMES